MGPGAMGSEGDASGEVLLISSRRDGDRGVVELEGELDLHGSDRLAAEVQQMLTDQVRVVEIDAARLTFTDSAGLRAVLLARSEVEHVGGTFWLSAVSAPVGRVIEIAGLSELLTPN